MKHARIVQNAAALDGQVDGEWIMTPDGRRLQLSEVTFAPPCAPTKVICVGFNYRDHAAELKAEIPKEPLLFLEPPSAVLAHQAPIPYPRHTRQLEYEGELAVVIGRRARNVVRDRALEVVWGYTIFNDVTARDVQQVEKQCVRRPGVDRGHLGHHDPGARRRDRNRHAAGHRGAGRGGCGRSRDRRDRCAAQHSGVTAGWGTHSTNTAFHLADHSNAIFGGQRGPDDDGRG